MIAGQGDKAEVGRNRCARKDLVSLCFNAKRTGHHDIVTTLRMSGPMSVVGDGLAAHAEAVILEAVSNTVRRSAATQLMVEVTVADELDITITGDGFTRRGGGTIGSPVDTSQAAAPFHGPIDTATRGRSRRHERYG